MSRPPVRGETTPARRHTMTRRRILRWLITAAALTGTGLFAFQERPRPAAPVASALATPTPQAEPPRPTPRPTSARLPTPTPGSPVTYYQGGFSSDPRSHDFNADTSCGGEPELFSGLVALTPDYEAVPDWAESWESSGDSRRWVFTIRRNRSGWSNGDPVRAQDFVWSWRRMLAPETGAPQASLLFDVVNARAVHEEGADPSQLGIRALDDWTIEIELEQPRSYFPILLGLPGLLPAHRPSVERWGEQWTEASACVSNGPFQLASWEHGRSFTLVRNPYYWNDGLHIDRCVTPILSAQQELVAFFRDELDLASVVPESLELVVVDPTLSPQLVRPVEPATWLLVPNTQRPPFDQLALRRALGMAIDRQRLWQLTYGAVRPATCLMPPGLPGHLDADDQILAGQRFDPDTAIALIQQTPYASPEAWPPVVLTRPDGMSPAERALADDVVAQLVSNLGMPLAVEEVTRPDWEGAIERGEFQLLWIRWDFPYPDPSAGYALVFSRSRSWRPWLGWEDQNYEALVRLGDMETDRLRRLAIYRQCERILQEQAVYVPIGYPVASLLLKPWVRATPRNRAGEPVGPNRLFSRFKWYLSLGERQTD